MMSCEWVLSRTGLEPSYYVHEATLERTLERALNATSNHSLC